VATRPVPVRGMRDFLPGQVRHRERVRAALEDVYRGYGYEPIETPAVEAIERLTSGEGGENETLLFKILRRDLTHLSQVGGIDELADLGLRYDLTVPLTRYYATNGPQLPDPFRSLQIGNVWRAERPQKGRYRQFVQCDIDLLGEPSNAAEIELLSATCDALSATGLSGFAVRVNDRRVLLALVASTGFPESLSRQVLIALDKLDKVGLDGVAEQLAPLGEEEAARRLLDVLAEQEAEPSLQTLAKSLGTLPDDVASSLDEVLHGLRDQAMAGVDVAFDATLVRGMGYYTGPIFEVMHAGSRGSIAGGGRYDDLVARSGGGQVPACGISIGFERLCEILPPREGDDRRRVIALHDRDAPLGPLLRGARELREQGYVVRRAARTGRMARQLARLEEEGYDLLWEFDPEHPEPTLRPLRR
jgi:histidyl-tRNA synthetase